MTSENFKILFIQGKNRTNKKNQSPLYCRLTLNGNRKQLSTGIHIETEHWALKTK
ncbi:Arm DNA-binding domain-containing protein [Flavobacterium urumqiense]|uniref:Arm DNA-binding domain-containing protein n=1 Tax=Flavobacterium urumqiense TaxID=935224 RepID=UPI001FC92FA9|nr:Arm DNA-binding domain-containing protein [Flavobacterium urumqiense]